MPMFGLPMKAFDRQCRSKEAPATPIYPIYNNTDVDGHVLYSIATMPKYLDAGMLLFYGCLYKALSKHPCNRGELSRHGVEL